MDVLRRNTDYALRAMVNLARHWKQGPVPVRQIASEEEISYQLACKLLQKLHNTGLLESYMGPKGGFTLSRKPSRISLLDIIGQIQGPLNLNRCLLSVDACRRRRNCVVTERLAELQKHIDGYLRGITLDDLLPGRGDLRGKKRG